MTDQLEALPVTDAAKEAARRLLEACAKAGFPTPDELSVRPGTDLFAEVYWRQPLGLLRITVADDHTMSFMAEGCVRNVRELMGAVLGHPTAFCERVQGGFEGVRRTASGEVTWRCGHRHGRDIVAVECAKRGGDLGEEE